MRRYFEKLEKQGVILSDRKRAWYVKKAETQLADMKREYPVIGELYDRMLRRPTP
jgi:DNA-binding transcriptional regulator YhcF (GntR family)